MELVAHHMLPRSGDIRHSTGSPALSRAILALPEPVLLRTGLGSMVDWIGGSHR
jgi:hypothetical protein